MKAAIYLRQSLDRTGEEMAVSRQREDCLALCARREGWEPVEYVDNDRSATRGVRPEYQRMLADIESGAIGAIIAWHPDRLYRKLADLLPLIELANKHSIQIATVQSGELDLSTDAGRLNAKILGAVSENEGERRTARQKRALLQRAQAGKGWGGRAFGYTAQDELEPIEAAAVREAFTTILHGGTLYSIAQAWNDAGMRTAKGGNRWVGETVRRVLMNPRYAGIRAYNREHYPAAWEAVVTEDIWRAVVAILTNPSRRTANSRVRTHMMTGLILCGECKRPMGVGTSHDRNRPEGQPLRKVYLCKAEGCRKLARDLDKVNKLVEDVMVERLSRPDYKEALTNPEDGVDLDALRAEAEAIQVQIDALPDAIANDGMSLKLAAQTERLLQDKLNAVESQMVSASDARLFDGLDEAPSAQTWWEGLDLDRHRAVIDRLVVFTVNRTKRGRGWHPEHIGVAWRNRASA